MDHLWMFWCRGISLVFFASLPLSEGKQVLRNFKSFVYNDLFISRSSLFLLSVDVDWLFSVSFREKVNCQMRTSYWQFRLPVWEKKYWQSFWSYGYIGWGRFRAKSSNCKTVNKLICQLKRDYRLGFNLSKHYANCR